MESESEEHLDPTAEITLDSVKKRAVKGVVVLTGRTFLLSLLSLVATGLLTVFLEPSEFGVFWIVSAVVNFLAYFSDVGLAAALIQKKEQVSDKDLKSTFTIQQILVITLIVLLVITTPLLERLYGLSFEGKLLLYSLGFSLFLSSLKTIPSVLLERRLEFGKLVIPQVIENLAYNLVAVYFAWSGLGIRSFTYAVLIRGIVGLIAMYMIKPWKPGFALHRKSVKELLRFGVPYQANSFLATIKDDGMTAVLGGILGASGVGLLGWAQKWGQAPLRFFMDHVIKVTFPAFSRLQDEKEHLTKTLERSVFFICFLVFPSVVALLILAPLLIEIIPRYQKWQPAYIPLVLISVNTIFASVTTQLTNILNAIGKIKVTFKLMIMWTILTWVLVPALAIKYGVVGAALGYSLLGLSSIIAVYVASRYVKFSLVQSAFKPAISAVVMGLVLLLVRSMMSYSVTSLIVLSILGFTTYMLISLFIFGISLVNDAKRSISELFSK